MEPRGDHPGAAAGRPMITPRNGIVHSPAPHELAIHSVEARVAPRQFHLFD